MVRPRLGIGDAEAAAVLERGNRPARGLDLGRVDLGHDDAGLDVALGEDLAPRIDDERMTVGLALGLVQACAAASTKQPVSIARARSSTCQCASPVLRVNADGTVRNAAPLSASARYSAGNRKS